MKAQESSTITLDDNLVFEQKSIIVAVSDCVLGRVSTVEKFLDTSSDAATFPRGRDWNGDMTLIMASREKTPGMVSLLLDRGSDVSAVNREGRSAFMETA